MARTKRRKLGNPALIAAASNPKTIEVVGRTGATLGKVLLVVAGGTTVFFVGRGALRKMERDKILNQVGSNPNYKAAVDVYNALPDSIKVKSEGIIAQVKHYIGLVNPINMINAQATKIAEIFTPAVNQRIVGIMANVTSLEDCRYAFWKLYRTELLDILNKVTTKAELDSIISKVQTNSQRPVLIDNSQNISKTGMAKTSTTVYVSFVQGGKVIVVPHSNPLPQYTDLGTATGRKHNVPAQNTTYIEFRVPATNGSFNLLYIPEKNVEYVNANDKRLKRLNLAEFTYTAPKPATPSPLPAPSGGAKPPSPGTPTPASGGPKVWIANRETPGLVLFNSGGKLAYKVLSKPIPKFAKVGEATGVKYTHPATKRVYNQFKNIDNLGKTQLLYVPADSVAQVPANSTGLINYKVTA